jgi:hypothetical protein
MRNVLGFLGVFALGLMLSVGCSEDGAPGFPCTEEGIRDAIAEGGGPHTFDCDGAQTVVTEFEIVIDNDVILDGAGDLTVDGNEEHRVFSVPEGVTAELRGLLIRGGSALVGDVLEVYGGGIENSGELTLINTKVLGNSAASGGGVANGGTLTLVNSVVSGNSGERPTFNGGGGIINGGTLTLVNSVVSANSGYVGGGISSGGTMTLVQSTVSGNNAALGGGGILNFGAMAMVNCTVSGNSGSSGRGIYIDGLEESTITGSIVDGDCSLALPAALTSSGHNIESPGDTCGFDTDKGDLFDVTAEQLNLGPLHDNGGPTETHALLPGSAAIDQIPEADCVDGDGEPLTTDQRGEPRPAGDGCDVGAFEVQP